MKGFLILLVLYGHIIQNISPDQSYYNDWIFRVIYSFHMPLFAIINGYLFYSSQKKRTLKKSLLSKLSGILMPIFIWSIIDWIIVCLLHKTFYIYEFINILTGNMLWFLWSILAANLILLFAEKIFKIKIFKILWLILGFFAMYLFPNCELNLFLYPFVTIGFYWKKYESYVNNIKKYGWITIVLFIAFIPFYNENSFIYTTGITLWNNDLPIWQHLLIDIYRYSIGLIGSTMVAYLISFISNKFKLIDNIFSIFGKFSMQIYILQCFFFKFFSTLWNKLTNNIINNIFFVNPFFRDIIIAIPICFILLLILLIISVIIKKIKKLNLILFGR